MMWNRKDISKDIWLYQMAYEKYIKDHLVTSKCRDDNLIWYFDILQFIVALFLI